MMVGRLMRLFVPGARLLWDSPTSLFSVSSSAFFDSGACTVLTLVCRGPKVMTLHLANSVKQLKLHVRSPKAITFCTR